MTYYEFTDNALIEIEEPHDFWLEDEDGDHWRDRHGLVPISDYGRIRVYSGRSWYALAEVVLDEISIEWVFLHSLSDLVSFLRYAEPITNANAVPSGDDAIWDTFTPVSPGWIVRWKDGYQGQTYSAPVIGWVSTVLDQWRTISPVVWMTGPRAIQTADRIVSDE